MNIPQLHTNLFWDLSCLTIFLTGIYFGCIIFFRSPFWKSIATAGYFSELVNLGKSHIFPVYSGAGNQGINDTKNAYIDYTSTKSRFENFGPEIEQGKTVNDIEVDYEVQIDPAIEKQIHEILESYAKEQGEKKIIFYKDKEDSNRYRSGEGMLDFGDIVLPTAKFYSKKENKRVKLLYAIAELGDAREVPLLQGMLDQERNESIGILIKEIILGFLSERPSNKKEESTTPEIGHLCEHYVYKYLFRAIDAESQHLLLDEVLKIGGAEELNFLRTLILHPDESIREKARSISNQLEQKLHPPQEDGIATEYEAAKLKITDPKNWSGILFVNKIGEMFYPKFREMGMWVSSHIKAALQHLSLMCKTARTPLEIPILEDKGGYDILHIDFELGIPEIKGQKIDLNGGKNEMSRSNLFPRLKQLIPMVLSKMGRIFQKYK